MNSDHPKIVPLACDMTVFTTAERELHTQATKALLQSLQTVQEAENGYEFSFPNSSEIIMSVAEFMTNERLCCPFLEFTLKIIPNTGLIRLLLTGPDGTQKFLRAEFSEAFA